MDVERTPRPEETYGAAYVKKSVNVLGDAKNIVSELDKPNWHMGLE